MIREEIARTPRIPHNPRTVAVLAEALRILSSCPPFDPAKSVADNWQRLCEDGDRARHLLIREIKILDHENFVLSKLLDCL